MKPILDWSAWKDAGMGDAYADIPRHGGNYAKAIAACINSRQCEAAGKQVMCPSFRVSGNPALSTGGRVRLLKAALNSDQENQPLLNPQLAEAMDLCVGCKGCKRECEANVDMPLIKAEYLAQKYQHQPRPWRSRLLASVPDLLHRYPLLGKLIAWRNRSPWLARLGERFFGLTAAVALPEPAPFHAAPLEPASPPDAPSIALWLDTFSLHFEPDIGQAAIKVLQACGYQVVLVGPASADQRPLCCGRTWLAQGMVTRARSEAQRLIQQLWQQTSAGITVVGLEASCVLGLRDDAKALGLDAEHTAKLENVAAATLLLEELLARQQRQGSQSVLDGTALHNTAYPEAISLVHGHCHQKATGAMKAMRRVLKMINNHDFEIIDSGCCGMAGSFGLEHEHHEMAKTMAELALLPALQAHPGRRIVANGFSCRQQIRAHSSHQPVHLAQVLAAILPERQP